MHLIGGGSFLADMINQEKNHLNIMVGDRFSNLNALKQIS
jgi:hypothetical protein